MRHLTVGLLLTALITPSMASAQVVGFGFGYHGNPGHHGPYVYGTVYYPSPGYVYPSYAVPYTTEVLNDVGQARITVLLPDDRADLIVQGQLMQAKGKTRTFVSQQLQTGRTYSYTITVRGETNGVSFQETRKVEFQAGNAITVDFNKALVEPLPTPDVVPAPVAAPLPK